MPGKIKINNLTTLSNIFRAFEKLKVLIIGDVMIDSYIWGKVDRISPEAPVPIVSVEKRDMRLGGAANVALNIQSLGAKPILCSVIGNDLDGDNFVTLLKQNKLPSQGIIRSKSRITTIKHRIISGAHHMLRVDSEIDTTISKIAAKVIKAKKVEDVKKLTLEAERKMKNAKYFILQADDRKKETEFEMKGCD